MLPLDDATIHQQWREQVGMTTPQSFAVSFLNYVRAEVQPLIAIADSIADLVVKPSLQPTEAVQSKEPETKSGLYAVSEASKNAMENVSTFNGNRGGKDRRKSTGTILQAIQEPTRLQLPVYDDDFPALGNAPKPNVKKTVTQSKQVVFHTSMSQMLLYFSVSVDTHRRKVVHRSPFLLTSLIDAHVFISVY